MSPSGAIGEIVLTFPGNQERTISDRLYDQIKPGEWRVFVYLFVAGRDVDLMTVSDPGGQHSLSLSHSPCQEPLSLSHSPCQMSSSTPAGVLLLAMTEGEFPVTR